MKDPHKIPAEAGKQGLIPGGRGGPEDELLEDGQEEVFSRTEVEAGAIEHHVSAGGAKGSAGRPG